jgi:hypothetical protein
MQEKISLTFNDLDGEMARALTMAYCALVAERREGVRSDIEEVTRSLPPVMPPVAADGPKEPANVPAAAPSTSPTPATASTTPKDNRGVPHHPDHHAALKSSNGGLNPDGTWKRRRGHDKAAADAYEAQFIAVSPNAASNAAFPAPPVAGSNGASAAITPPPPGCPGMEDFTNRWLDLVQRGRVGPEHEQYIIANWNAHPVANAADYAADPVRRTAVYQFMGDYR